MANASTKEAPLIQKDAAFLPQFKFDKDKKYMFELVESNPERELPVINMTTKRAAPHQAFKPYQNLVLTSQIVWENERRTLRYYDGCTTLFVDEQPKDKDIIDQYIKQSKKRAFIEGKFGVFGDERLLLIYLNICSWNASSEYRTRTSTAIFKPVNADQKANSITSKLDLIEEAMKYAREAKPTKMMIHASYLGIPTTDWDSGNELTEKEIRALYREEASRNPENFIKTFGNQALEIQYYIDKSLENGTISNRFNPNKATWGQKNTEICDISGLKTNDAISQRLFEFSQTEAGEEFKVQLIALYS